MVMRFTVTRWILAAAVAWAPGSSLALTVRSADIVPADGTTGQTLTMGAGVKTGHIQNSAVTDVKIAGPISTSKLNVGTTPGTVAAGDHNHDAVYQKKYANVVVVAKSGGDYADINLALQAITDASASNRYLVKVMPGEYSPTAWIISKDYVDVEGSGPSATKFVLTDHGLETRGGGFTEWRNLAIQVTGNSGGFAGITVTGGSPRFTNIRISVINAGTNQSATAYGVFVGASQQPVFTNIDVDVTSTSTSAYALYGLYVASNPATDAPFVVKDSRFTLSGGQFIFGATIGMYRAALNGVEFYAGDATTLSIGLHVGGTGGQGYNPQVTFENGKLRGGNASAQVDRVNAYANLFVTNSKLDGPVLNNGGVLKSVGCYDANFDLIANGAH